MDGFAISFMPLCSQGKLMPVALRTLPFDLTPKTVGVDDPFDVLPISLISVLSVSSYTCKGVTGVAS